MIQNQNVQQMILIIVEYVLELEKMILVVAVLIQQQWNIGMMNTMILLDKENQKDLDYIK